MKVNRNIFNDQEKDILKKSASIINKLNKNFKDKDIYIEFRNHIGDDFTYDIPQVEEIRDFLIALSKDNFEIDD